MTQTGSLNLLRRMGKAVVVFIVLSEAHGDPEKGEEGSCWKPNTKAKTKSSGRWGARLCR